MPRVFCFFAALAMSLALAAGSQDAPERLLPPALQAFEHLIGEWRSHGWLETDKLNGWDETHTWGWRFDKGKIVGMEIAFKDGRYFAAAKLTPRDLNDYDTVYQLTATTPGEKEVAYEGTLKSGKSITFVRQKGDASAPDQLSLQLLHDVRYTTFIESKKSTTAKRVATIGSTRADVRFGAAGKEEQGPKCIITGAPGTSTVSFKGQTYYVCCSGCRSEFEHDPEKWLKLAKEGKGKKEIAKSSGGESESDATKPKDNAKSKPAEGNESKPKTEPREPKKSPGKDGEKPKESDSDAKSASSLLARGKLLEKNGKRDEAIKIYERLLKEHPKAAEAEEAESRLKALRSDSE